MADRVFLAPKELESFEQYHSRFGRYVQALSAVGEQSSEPLEGMVQGLVHDYLDARSRGFKCRAIKVVSQDGMSWSAQAVDTAIEEVAPHVQRLRLKGEPGAGIYPELTQLIPIRRIISLAHKRGLVTSVKHVGRRRSGVIIIGALVAGVVGSALAAAVSQHSLTAASLTLPFLAISVVIAGLGLLSQLLLSTLQSDSTSSPHVRAAEDIANHAKKDKPSDAYFSFIDDLAVVLTKFVTFRCLIVDDFTRLDNVTRKVLEAYLESYANDLRDELWILFCSTDDKWLDVSVSRSERVSKKPLGYKQTRLYSMEHLSAAQRRELAEENGTPERARYLTVGAIVRDNSLHGSMAELFQQEYDARKAPTQGARVGDILDFFYIFALNALPGQNSWLRKPDVRTNFSQQRKYRSQILRALMPGCDLSKTKVTSYLKTMSDTFFPLAGETTGSTLNGRFLVAPEACEELTDSWRKFDLANPGIVHLFWTLYWTDTELRGALNIAMLPKICAHMLRSATPAEVKEQIGGSKAAIASFADDFFNIALETLRACLRTCVLGDVPALLDHALRLAEDDNEQVERRRRARLRPLAWQAYGLLGDERLLAVVLELQMTTAERPSQVSQKRDLTYLFLQSMTSADRRARDLMLNELARAGKHARVYTRIRASWLAISLAPFLRTGTPSLIAATADARDQLPEIVAESITNLESVADAEWRTTDILNVVLGLWSLTLASDDRRAGPGLTWNRSDELAARIVDALVEACVLGIELSEQRRLADPNVVTLDLALDCLAEELLVVLLAGGVLLLERWPDSAWNERVDRAKVIDVVRQSAVALGVGDQAIPAANEQLSRELIKDVERRMTLLTVLWWRLGFVQQASFTTIRQAQFMALSHPRDADLAQSVLELLPGELNQADHIGLLAHLAAAESAAVSVELTGRLLARCSQISVKGGFGDRLAAELCLEAIRVGNVYNIDFSADLDYLLARWSEGNGGRLDTLLDAVSAEDMPFIVNEFLNAMGNDDSDRLDRVRDALDRRMLVIGEPQVRKKVRGLFGAFTLKRQTRAGQAVDVSAELDVWQEMKDLADYAYVLYLLLPTAPPITLDRITHEAINVLQSPDNYLNSSGYVYLAERMLRRFSLPKNGSSSDLATALNALKGGFAVWEKQLSADDNVDILKLLIRHDGEHAEGYLPRYFEWKRVVLELDETRRLPELVDQGRFFLLIWHYFQFFAEFSVQSGPPIAPSGLNDPESSAALKEWRADHRRTPDPTVGTGKDLRLSGVFLRRGYALFFMADDQKRIQSAAEKELEAGRKQFDAKAREAIEAVYQILRALPQIPQSIEQILKRHEEFVLARLSSLEDNLTED